MCEGLIENIHVCKGLIENIHVCEGLPPSAGETRTNVDWVIHYAPCDRVWMYNVIQCGPCDPMWTVWVVIVVEFHCCVHFSHSVLSMERSSLEMKMDALPTQLTSRRKWRKQQWQRNQSLLQVNKSVHQGISVLMVVCWDRMDTGNQMLYTTCVTLFLFCFDRDRNTTRILMKTFICTGTEESLLA